MSTHNPGYKAHHKMLLDTPQDTTSTFSLGRVLHNFSIFQFILVLVGLMIVQDTVNLFIQHQQFAQTQLCTDFDQRLAGGFFAEKHCLFHESYAHAFFSIKTCM